MQNPFRQTSPRDCEITHLFKIHVKILLRVFTFQICFFLMYLQNEKKLLKLARAICHLKRRVYESWIESRTSSVDV